MTPAARVQAAIEILDRIVAGQAAEQTLTGWARGNRYAGSSDRLAIRDHVFDALRRRRSAAALGGGETGRALMIGLLRQRGEDLDAVFSGGPHAPGPLTERERHTPDPGFQMPEAVAADLPDWLLPLFRESLGDRAMAVAEALRHRAPVFLRVNLGRATREAAQSRLAAEGIATEPHPLAGSALLVTANARRVQQGAAFQEGIVELQDAASQAVVERIPLRDGDRILDYCAGGGGKSLALAARANVRVFAHDIDPRRMTDLPARAKRAGVRIAQLTTDQTRTEAPFDIVLTDVPCSGSGSWRRAPEAKWTLTPDRLAELETWQSSILAQASTLVRPGGYLVYATCSLMKRENQDQIAHFLSGRTEWEQVDALQLTPLDGGDGFYCAILRCNLR